MAHTTESLVQIRRALGQRVEEDVPKRPANRMACDEEPRPCRHISCKFNLFLDVNPDTGSITWNFPTVEIEDMKHSCALDESDKGGLTLEETGVRFGLTRERIRQIESAALKKLKDAAEKGLIPRIDFEALANVSGAGHVLSGVHAAKD